MKLIIDVPEKEYKKALEGEFRIDIFWDAVKNGTPLPKGHWKLINANDLRCEYADFDTYHDYCLMFDEIENATAVIEVDIFPSVGQGIKMFVDGEWKYGKVIEGYRYHDGIVSMETDNGEKYWCGQDRKDLYKPIEGEENV